MGGRYKPNRLGEVKYKPRGMGYRGGWAGGSGVREVSGCVGAGSKYKTNRLVDVGIPLVELKMQKNKSVFFRY